MTLHVYANSVIEWYVAESLDAAIEIARTYFRDIVGADEDEIDLDLEQVPDDNLLRIVDDEHGKREQSCTEWATENGPGFLCSLEF